MKNQNFISLWTYSKHVYVNIDSGVEKQTQRQVIDDKLERLKKLIEERGSNKEKLRKRVKEKKDQLYSYWRRQTVKEERTSDPRYEALAKIEDPQERKEVYCILSLLRKFVNPEAAKDAYRNGLLAGDKFDFKKFLKHLEKEKRNMINALGFYYEKGNWWTWDKDEGSDDEKMGPWLTKGSLNKIITDEFTTDKRAEGYLDSGLKREREDKIREYVKKQLLGGALDTNVNSKAFNDKVLEYFKKKADRWIYPKASILNYLTALTDLSNDKGSHLVKFMFRYSSKHDRIYFIQRADLTNLQKRNLAHHGYFQIKNGKVERDFIHKDVDLKKDLMGEDDKSMKPNEIVRELARYQLKKDFGSATLDQKIDATAGMTAAVLLMKEKRGDKKPKGLEIKYGDLKKWLKGDDAKSLVSKLTKKLEKIYPKRIAQQLAEIRANYVEYVIRRDIESNDEFYKLITDPKEKDKKIRVHIDKNDVVSVTRPKGLLDILKKRRQKEKDKHEDMLDKVTKPVDVVEDQYKKLKDRFLAGRGKGFTAFYNRFLEGMVKSMVKKSIQGKGGWFGGLVLGLIGFKVTKGLIGSKKVDQKKFDKLIMAKAKEQKLPRRIYFKKDIHLKDKKIVTKNGIRPGGPMWIRVAGIKDPVRLMPKAGTKKMNWAQRLKSALWGMFSKKQKAENKERKAKLAYQYANKEITIEGTIPKGTLLAKGAKIVRTKTT